MRGISKGAHVFVAVLALLLATSAVADTPPKMLALAKGLPPLIKAAHQASANLHDMTNGDEVSAQDRHLALELDSLLVSLNASADTMATLAGMFPVMKDQNDRNVVSIVIARYALDAAKSCRDMLPLANRFIASISNVGLVAEARSGRDIAQQICAITSY